MSLKDEMVTLARQAREASLALTRLSTADKNACLQAMADALEQAVPAIQEANRRDLAAGREAGLSAALVDRLELTDARLAAMTRGVREIADLPDPVGRILDSRTLDNGIRLEKVAVPIGVIVMIFESRPNVTVDAASLCFKAGNAVILRGGKEALHSNRILAETLVRAAREHLPAFPEHAIQIVPTIDRQAVPELLALTDCVDLCIPRGGEGLIRAVAECSRVPVIKHFKGVCHVYVDRAADLAMAARIALNSKVQRPGVCNAMETLLVDQAVADRFLPEILPALTQAGVEIRLDARTRESLPAELADQTRTATDEDWDIEYLDLILSVRVVADLEEAIGHINRHGSRHTESIVTSNASHAHRFLQEVDAAAVYWNASTRFTDGSVYGMGAEIGISTDKIGARGPMGLAELTTFKWVGTGTGQVRE